MLHAGCVAALSYRWLNPEHPDLHGFNLKAVRRFLRAPAARRRVEALMWDFTALPQRCPSSGADRSDEEYTRFKAGLAAMGNVYVSPRACSCYSTGGFPARPSTRHRRPTGGCGSPTTARDGASLSERSPRC